MLLRKTRNHFLFFILVISFAFSGCKSNDGPFELFPEPGDPKDATITPTNSVIPPKEFSTTIPSDSRKEKQTVLLFFLLDSSGSIIGNGESPNCKPLSSTEQNPIHRRTVMRFLSLLSKLPKDNLDDLHIAIGRFGSYYAQYDQRFFKGTEIGNKLQDIQNFVFNDPNNDSSTNYGDGLKKAKEEIIKYQKNNSITYAHLFLLTDGFRAQENMGVLEQEWTNLRDASVSVSVGLICPEKGDTSFWSGHGFDVLRQGPNQWLSSIFNLDDMKQFLPSQSGWIDGVETLTFPVPKFSRKAAVFFEEFNPEEAAGGIFINGNIINRVPSLNSPFVYDLHPTGKCDFGNVTLSPDNALTHGFWWIVYDPLPMPLISLDTPSNSDNNSAFSITAHLKFPSVDITQLSELRVCDEELSLAVYNSDPAVMAWDTKERLGLKIQPCPKGGEGLCFDADIGELYRTWNWNPQYNLPKEKVYFVSYLDWTDRQKLSNYVQSGAHFKPQMLENPFMSRDTNSPPIVKFKFPVTYDVVVPDISIFTNDNVNVDEKSIEVDKIYSGYICPSVDQKYEQKYYRIVHSLNGENSIYENRVVFDGDLMISPSDHIYTISAYEYVFSICGFDGFLFHWAAQSNSSESDWICTFVNKKIDDIDCNIANK